MKSNVYYGEYSLNHWIDLMLKKNIELPEYQRSFVWSERDIKRLMNSFKENQYVQPITIAHYSCSGMEKNLILDGQQRLTSLLLARLEYLPIKEKFENINEIANDDDSQEDEHADIKPIKWTFQELLDDNVKKNRIDTIIEKIKADPRYSHSELIGKVDDIDEFFNISFLGFAYIVPEEMAVNDIHKYFSTLFRNINYFGAKLSTLESRRSLYYMDDTYKNYFEGLTSKGDDVLCNIHILEQMQSHRIDFVRYLSILSQFFNTNDKNKVLVGYSAYSSRESFYADYVSYIIGQEQENRIDKFDDFTFNNVFPDGCWQNRLDDVRAIIESNMSYMNIVEKNGKENFSSWIDADYWLFGLLYFIIFIGKRIKPSTELFDEISKHIEEKRKLQNYVRVSNRLGLLRERLLSSITIYEKYTE